VLLSLALGAALAAIVAMTGVAREAEAAFPGGNGKIAFESDRTTGKGVNNPTGDVEIFAMDVKGTNLKNLTNNSVYDGAPDWSPNGAKIAFTSNRNTNDDIYAMNADESGQKRLTRNATAESFAVWSPNGRKMAFQTLRHQGDHEIFTMKASGEAQTQLTNNPFADLAPDWQPLVN